MPKAQAKSILPKEREKDIQKGIIQGAALLGWRLWHFDAGAARKATGGESPGRGGLPPAGWPDLCGLTSWGQFVGFEVKRPGEKPTQKQLAKLASLQSMGAIVGWFTAIDDAITYIKDVNHVYAQSEARPYVR